MCLTAKRLGYGLILILLLTPIGAAFAITLDSGVGYLSRSGGGVITLNVTLEPSQADIADNFLLLTAPLTYFQAIGVDAPAGCDVTVTGLDSYNLYLETSQTAGDKTIRVYLPGRIAPGVVMFPGASSYDATSKILTVTTTMNTIIRIHWAGSESGQISGAAGIIAALIPLMMIIYALNYTKHGFGEILLAAVLVAVLEVMALIILGWGF